MRSAAAPRPTRLRTRATALALALTAVGAVAAAAPAQAASTKHPRVAVIAASADYLLYRQKTATASGLLYTEGSTLLVADAKGHRRTVADFDPQLFPDLQGSTLTQSARPNSRFGGAYDERYDPAAPEHVRWRELRTGAHGVTEIPAGEDYAGAAPGGWVVTRIDGAAVHVVRYRTTGSTTDLGSPFADGVPYSVEPGPGGVVATSSGSGGAGAIRYRPYSTSGSWSTVLAAGAGAEVFCTEPSGTHVGCEVERVSPGRSGIVLLALDGRTRTWLQDHPRACQTLALEAVGRSAFGRAGSDEGRGCSAGQLTQLTAKGTLSVSARRYGARSSNGLAGLGGYLTSADDQRRIVRVTSAKGAPRTIATAR